MHALAIIGISGFAHQHYLDILREVEAGRARIVAATVINQAEEAEKCATLRRLGAKLFDDFHEMFAACAGRIDLCHIPTGIPMHCTMTCAALAAGANVIVEKPAAATIQEVRQMKAAAAAANRFVAVAFQSIYAPQTLLIKQAILEGRIGRLRAIRSRGFWIRPDSYYARNSWAGRLKLGDTWVLDSPFNNAFAHQLNMLGFLAGSERERSAELASVEAELYRAHRIESADTAALRMTTVSGVPLCLYVSHCPEARCEPEIEILGEAGRIHWTLDRCRIKPVGGSVEDFLPDDYPLLRRHLTNCLFTRLEQGQGFICDLDIAAVHTLAVNGAHESSLVREIPAPYVRRFPEDESIRTVIVGLDHEIDVAYQAGRLLSEVGTPWAVPGKRVDVRHYDRFPSAPEVVSRAALR